MNNLDRLAEVNYLPTKVCNYVHLNFFKETALVTGFLILPYYFVLTVFSALEAGSNERYIDRPFFQDLRRLLVGLDK